MNVFILEDDIMQQQRLKRMVNNYAVKNHQDIEIMGTSRPQELLNAIMQKLTNNFYFLDIQIKSKRQAGLELAQRIRAVDPFGWIVFVTTHSELLPITFKYKVAALDFIEKSSDEISFERQVEDCLNIACSKQNNLTNSDIFSFKNKYSDFRLPFSEILYFETTESAHKIRLVTLTKHSEFYSTLKEIEKMDDRLFKCHRAYVVNLDNIRKVNRATKTVSFGADEECLVSRGKLKLLLKKLAEKRLEVLGK